MEVGVDGRIVASAVAARGSLIGPLQVERVVLHRQFELVDQVVSELLPKRRRIPKRVLAIAARPGSKKQVVRPARDTTHERAPAVLRQVERHWGGSLSGG